MSMEESNERRCKCESSENVNIWLILWNDAKEKQHIIDELRESRWKHENELKDARIEELVKENERLRNFMHNRHDQVSENSS